jgi:hypothetical protein
MMSSGHRSSFGNTSISLGGVDGTVSGDELAGSSSRRRRLTGRSSVAIFKLKDEEKLEGDVVRSGTKFSEET